ncbi:hypothetical protein DFH07DRAFT_385561 [Mycena maculata]|uniref:Uncharacterized protein n=1 Tax=Mycena maculata TaxID=230809 RepID=A0AAD7KCI3_9AGAR|nr:hypothetical protein DFH07DRAFT_385561 [Mycena maculata]
MWSVVSRSGAENRELSRTDLNTDANRILIGRTMHDYGVAHGDVVYPPDSHHLILDVDAPGLSRADLLNGKAPCYIVEFSHACAVTGFLSYPSMHMRLQGKLDVPNSRKYHTGSTSWRLHAMCLFGRFYSHGTHFLQCRPIARRTRHRSGATNTPRYFPTSNADVLPGQRAKFYSEMPPLYPELDVSFEGPGECSKMIIYRDSDWAQQAPRQGPTTSTWSSTGYGSRSQKNLSSL